jgi:nucleotide-binding universal stress UspA family protein
VILLKNILLATDFSETASVAARYAKAFAEMFGATLHVLHVLEDPVPGWKPPGHVASVPIIRANMEQDAREQMSHVLTEAERGRLHPRTTAKWGNPFVEIVRYAKEQSIDLIVLGTYGRGPIGHMLMGSVAEKVVRHSPCPVFTVRHPEHEFVMP